MRSHIDLAGFTTDLDALVANVRANWGERELRHLRKFEVCSNLCLFSGLIIAGTAAFISHQWLLLVPAAILISLGRSSRWILMHHISHGGYDKVPGVRARYTSSVFAHGWRRLIHWPDLNGR